MFYVAVGDIGKRVREARRSMAGEVRIADLARILKIDHGRLSNWERGQHDPPTEMLSQIADATGVQLEWLVGEPVPMRDPTRHLEAVADLVTPIMVPVYGAITAGMPAVSHSEVIEWVRIFDRGGGGEFRYWGRPIIGSSMEPDLDEKLKMIAVFDNRRPEPGHIVHAFDDGEDTVKQYRRTHDGIPLLVPTNPEFDIMDGRKWNIKGVCCALVYRDLDGGEVLKEYPNGMRPFRQRTIPSKLF